MGGGRTSNAELVANKDCEKQICCWIEDPKKKLTRTSGCCQSSRSSRRIPNFPCARSKFAHSSAGGRRKSVLRDNWSDRPTFDSEKEGRMRSLSQTCTNDHVGAVTPNDVDQPPHTHPRLCFWRHTDQQPIPPFSEHPKYIVPSACLSCPLHSRRVPLQI
jgi:hypothetical protein